MKTMIIALLLTASLAAAPPADSGEEPGRRGQIETPAAVLPAASESPRYESMLSSYYTAQGSLAHEKIQKGAFGRFLKHWTYRLEELENPVWNFDTFTHYQILDDNLKVISDPQLYCCTFSDDTGRHGYVVVRYHHENGGGLQNTGTVETAYQYDLQTNLPEITELLAATGLDLATAEAVRGRLHDQEIILFTDGRGDSYVYDLATRQVTPQ